MLNVSIVIPAWNEQERINDCLLNATRQTVMPHEVIVVDNRSTDSTVAVVEQFMKDHPEAPVKLLHQDDEQGLIPTRDYGLNHATGDIQTIGHHFRNRIQHVLYFAGTNRQRNDDGRNSHTHCLPDSKINETDLVPLRKIN